MVISVYGAGYVGLVSATCLAKLGHRVLCADIDKQRIDSLSKGECPIYEQNLPELLEEQLEKNQLMFTADLNFAIKSAEVHIIATGTPSLANGEADLSQVFSVVSKIVQVLERDGILILKSTVPVGTGDKIQQQIKNELNQLKKELTLFVASNPEFLREGTAVADFLNADRIIIGGEEPAIKILKSIYAPLSEKGIPIVEMSHRSAELTKYAANAMLACKISFMNQISRFAEEFEADIDEIREGMSLDHRIGPHFLHAGIGYGGSCFPKDVQALIQTAKTVNIDTSLLSAIESINQLQKNWVCHQLMNHFNGALFGLTIGLWGLSFKPGTDDLRDASSLRVVNCLLEKGVKLRIFDPVAMPAAQHLFAEDATIHWCKSAFEVPEKQLDALIIATEWPQFLNYPLELLKDQLGDAPLFDGRNCYPLSAIRDSQFGFYYSVGRKLIKKQTHREALA